jgi:hypothetical protein
MKNIWISLGLLVAIGACDGGTAGNGDVTSTSRPLTGFSRVEAAGAARVRVLEGSGYAVTVTTDSNLQPLVETRVLGETLLLTEHGVGNTTELLYAIELPTLRGVTQSGSGDLQGDVSSSHELDIALDGSGTVSLSGPATAVTASLSGSGSLALAGTADSLSASLSGSGGLDARDFPVERAAFSLSGSGGVRATVLGSVTFQMTGSGDIDWWGPAIAASTVLGGSGRIAHH